MRLFIALPLPPRTAEAVRVASRLAQERLSGDSDVRWQPQGNLHVTLHFLGDIDEARLGEVTGALATAVSRSAPFELSLSHYGVFPAPRRPSVLWLGLDGDLAALHGLHERLTLALTGVWRNQERLYHPHLTLARVRRLSTDDRTSLGQLIGQPPPLAASWQADRVHLLESKLHPSGAIHTVLAEEPLKAVGARGER